MSPIIQTKSKDGSGEHNAPLTTNFTANIDFDINGFILCDLEAELKDIKATSQKWYKLVNNFYKVLINLQKEQIALLLDKNNAKVDTLVIILITKN